MSTKPEQNHGGTEAHSSSASNSTQLLVGDARLHAKIDVLIERERKRVHEWYGYRLKALKEWARTQDEDVCNAVFGCIANGRANWDGEVNYAAQYNSLKHALHAAEEEILCLKERLAELEAN